MNRIVAAIVLAAFAAASAGCTTPNGMQTPPAANTASQTGNAQHPWERAQAVVRATNEAASKGGIGAIRLLSLAFRPIQKLLRTREAL